ncbi:hypothetical protein KQX54_003405 [Cotesia glomerata]|uniref:Peptidase S1 domain-containing protein n=1 Tax=Cotesia glomerata TaxID=32391 RepID=A0AAV7IHK6_COTGL|nr:hypothetical protein KQX54_003405 [Cotesia glomerata]
MMLLISLLFIIIPSDFFLNSADANLIQKWKLNQSFVKEWEVYVKSSTESAYCYGLFLGPNKFLTFAHCVKKIEAHQFVFVTNEHNVEVPRIRNISVDRKSIYFGMELRGEFDESQREFAVLKTEDEVIAESDVTAHTFIKIAEDINQVDPKSCFILGSEIPRASHVNCKVLNSKIVGSANRFNCAVASSDNVWRQSGLFCNLKENSRTIVLLGLVSNGFYRSKDFNDTIKSVINLTGLKITTINQITEIKNYDDYQYETESIAMLQEYQMP